MRSWPVLVLLQVLAVGCRETPREPPAREATERLARLQEEEGDVLARRAELSRERSAVDAERAALDDKRKRVSASGGDLVAVEAELQALRAREQRLIVEEAALGRKLDALLSGYQEISLTGGARDTVAREAQVAVREKDISRREAALAEREAALAARERELLRREREAPPAILAAAPPATARYTRKDVEPLLLAARRKMGDKGLLASDLPAPVRDLEREAAAAMSSGDWARARFAADQLVATVDAVKVDKAFIMAKIGRLNAAVKGAAMADTARRQVEDLFRDATADYGDGQFAAANAKLNRIYGVLD